MAIGFQSTYGRHECPRGFARTGVIAVGAARPAERSSHHRQERATGSSYLVWLAFLAVIDQSLMSCACCNVDWRLTFIGLDINVGGMF